MHNEAHNCFNELRRYMDILNQNSLDKMKTMIDDQFSIKNQENLEKINYLNQENIDKSSKIKINEEKIQNLEMKLLSLGIKII
jgi:hypothetical protein